jgi:hypothetical protein
LALAWRRGTRRILPFDGRSSDENEDANADDFGLIRIILVALGTWATVPPLLDCVE